MNRLFATLAVAVLAMASVNAQISISDGTSKDAPNVDAAFEISSSTQGFLLPRLRLFSLDSPKPLRTFTPGMLIYNLANDADKGVTPGLHYSDGARWVRISCVMPDTPTQDRKQEEVQNAKRNGVYQPPMECRTFDISVGSPIPEGATVLLTLEHAGEVTAMLSIREIDRARNVISVTSNVMLPTFARIHWLIVE